MSTYYNEFDKKKCAALKQLMSDGYISKGEIDDRPIQDVKASDLRGFDRCHFFAGIGLWDYALDLAGWEKDKPVWTGSCPCQPFSTAGRQKGKADDRHLWPEWLRLIESCRPDTIFGEQVANSIKAGVPSEKVFNLQKREAEKQLSILQREIDRRTAPTMYGLSKRVREKMAIYIEGVQAKTASKEEREGQKVQGKMDFREQGEVSSVRVSSKMFKKEYTIQLRCSCCGNTIKNGCWDMRGEWRKITPSTEEWETLGHAINRPYKPRDGVCVLEYKDCLFCDQCRLWRLGAGNYKENYDDLVRRFMNEQRRVTGETGSKSDEAAPKGWLDDVYQGLESEGYAIGSAVLPASSVGAPHRRERLWFVGISGIHESQEGQNEKGRQGEVGDISRVLVENGSGGKCEESITKDSSTMGNTKHDGPSAGEKQGSNGATIQHNEKGSYSTCESEGADSSRNVSCQFCEYEFDQESLGKYGCPNCLGEGLEAMGNAKREGLEGHTWLREDSDKQGWEYQESGRPTWETGVWIPCPDGKQRLVEPGIPLLAHGYPERVGVIHCAGDAIVPQVAAEFIRASMGVV